MDNSSQKLENDTILTLYIQLKFLYLTLCLCNLEMPQIFPKWIRLSDNIRNRNLNLNKLIQKEQATF